MRISVIGMGVVGTATFQLFEKLGHIPEGCDKVNYQLHPRRSDFYFICVPEGDVEEPVKWIAENLPEGLIVVRSSVLPKTCQALDKKYGRHICHNPEFLRESTALFDEMNPSRVVIGECCWYHGDELEKLYKPLQCTIVRTNPATSELTKLASNFCLASYISYWNEIEQIAKKIGVSGHQVGMIASLDPRISTYGSRFHQKFGGRCLPKDTQQLIDFAQSLGYDSILLKAVQKVNDEL